MIFWLLAIIFAALVCASLFYAGRTGAVNVALAEVDSPERVHHRNLLAEIEYDLVQNRISADEAGVAKAELARDVLRAERMQNKAQKPIWRGAPIAGIAIILVVSFVIYSTLGQPNLPAEPLASREKIALADMDVNEAVVRVEAALRQSPDDVRGWQVIAPIYMRSGRYVEAEQAFRRVLELLPPTAKTQVDLVESIMAQNNGRVNEEALTLLSDAMVRAPDDARSRFYVAGYFSEIGEYDRSIVLWTEIISKAEGTEPWLENARRGLEFAQLATSGGAEVLEQSPEQRADTIRTMVQGLSDRLDSDGGTIKEWTRLVRAQLVLGQAGLAQDAYDKAKAAYPDAPSRQELDAFAAQNGLK